MTSIQKRAPWIGALISGALLVSINAVLSLYVWAPIAQPARALVPIPESLVFLIVFWILARVGTNRGRTWGAVVAGSVFGIYLGFSAAEAFFQFYFARPFFPSGDIGMIRGALLLFFGDIGPLATRLTPVVIVVLFALLGALGSVVTFGIIRLLRSHKAHPGGAAAVLMVALIAMLVAGLPRSLSGRVLLGWFEGADGFVPVEVAQIDATGDTDSESSYEHYTFPGLLDRDIYVFVIEAYGYASVNRPELSRQIEPYRARLQTALREQGYSMVSSYLESPVAGGYSWLAEATLLSGQLVNSQERFLNLVEARLPTLTGTLHEGGYYTLTVRPGTVHASWPEAWEVYRFEESIVAHDGDFAFVGPWFSYVPVTDQYAIWTGHRRIAKLTAPGGAAEDRPLLVYYQLVSSHTPFNAIPPMIDPWEALGDGSIYNERADEIQRFANSWTGGTELEEGYVAGIGYVFDVLSDYVSRVMDHARDPIIVILGDHQPQRPIRAPENHKSVPIHIAARDREVLSGFVRNGFEPGTVSRADPPHRHMKEFFPFFVELAATPPSAE